MLPQKSLRQELIYEIQADYKGLTNSFLIRQNLKFVPISCFYLVANGSDAYSYRQVSKQEIGVQEIEILLKVQKNDQIDSEACKFYDKFDRLEYKFFLKNSEDQPQNQPKLNLEMINDNAGNLESIKAILPPDQ